MQASRYGRVRGRGIVRSPHVCTPPTLSLIGWLTSSDVSVSALRARLMADGVSADTVVVVEDLVISPPANSTLPSSTATGESPVVGQATLESVSFSSGKTVRCVSATRFCCVRGRGIVRSPHVCTPPTLSLIGWLTSSDVSVSALRARLMADGVSADTVVVVEDLVISPPANSTLPSSTATGESPVVGQATLESVSFSSGKTVRCVSATRFC